MGEQVQRRLGGVGTRMLFENDRVRVWELDLQPGEESAVHQHELDYLLVQIEGDRIAVVPEPDTQGPYPDYLEADAVPGVVAYIARGGIETARNVGEKRYRELIIELKD
jgi:predicted metal-dependent enzyme (double-stranded beta helix superfamily)